MSNVSIREFNNNLLRGTILAGGTLSGEIDLMGFTKIGLLYSGATNGTLGFQVAVKPDADGGTYYDLLGSNGVALAFGPSGASGAVSGVVLEPLQPYRYIKVKSSIAQATGVQLLLPVKA